MRSVCSLSGICPSRQLESPWAGFCFWAAFSAFSARITSSESSRACICLVLDSFGLEPFRDADDTLMVGDVHRWVVLEPSRNHHDLGFRVEPDEAALY